MAQFTIYKSTDTSAPVLTGEAGSLIALFKACLVDGYGSKSSVGWTQPVATSGNIGSFKMPSGTGFGFVLNDNGPNGISTYKEAWAIGYTVVTGVDAPYGAGTNAFPTTGQYFATGHLVIRKSVAASNVARDWILAADSKTLHLFILTGDTLGMYYGFSFGDFLSLKSNDAYNCIMVGRQAENSAAATQEGMDALGYKGANAPGHIVARVYTGAGGAALGSCHVDGNWMAATKLNGTGPFLHSIDGAPRILALQMHDYASLTLRGRKRGLWAIAGILTDQYLGEWNLFDQQVITPTSGLHYGRSFLVIRQSANGGLYLLETSDTLDTY